MGSTTVPPPQPNGLTGALTRNIEALERQRREENAQATREQRIAGAITKFTGSMVFVYLHLVVYGTWIVVNAGVIPWVPRFDPSFVILATEASVEAIFLSTFVLISQNRASASADRRADLDLHISLLTEHELTKLAEVIEAIANRLGVDPVKPAEMAEVKKDVAPEAVLEEISARQGN